MNEGFPTELFNLMKNDDSIVLIVADTGWGIFPEFKDTFPSRCIDFGICEQTIISISAGMALSGIKPYVYGITSFLIERPFEQVKLDIVENNANVKLIGYWNRKDWGITHYTKNIRRLCNILRLRYREPKTTSEVEEVLKNEYKMNSPCFILLPPT